MGKASLHKEEIELSILGPFDRFNYGDLLFPKMIIFAFEKLFPNEYSFNLYGLAAFDLTKRGGDEGKSIRYLYKELTKEKSINLVVAGGESIGLDWHFAFRYISKSFYFFSSIKYVRFLLRKLKIAKFILGGRTSIPFVISKTSASHHIIYNSVGSIFLEDDKIAKQLDPADYLAVRDHYSLQSLEKMHVSNLQLAPDCAAILSDVFHEEYFSKCRTIRNEVRTFIAHKYIVFQLFLNKGDDIFVIHNQLSHIKNIYNVNICLLVFADLPNNGDFKTVIKLMELDNSYIYFDKTGIDEIAFLLKNAFFYIGTSLHGIISSISFQVPFVGIQRFGSKVRYYLETWGSDNFNSVASIRDFARHVEKILNCNYQIDLEKIALDCKNKYYDSVRRINSLISNKD